MINLLHLMNLHFPTLSFGLKIKNFLNKNLSLVPEDLSIYIYRLQREIIYKYGEENSTQLLLCLSYIQRMYTQIEIYYSSEIGNNFKIVHGLGTVIGARVKIEDNVTIYQGVTLGDRGNNSIGRPTIQSNVTIYAGAKILGDIVIGNNSIVSANAVVLSTYKPYSLIGGVPSKKLKAL